VWLALARQEAEPLVEALSALPQLPAMAQWATFLRNHDELDLSRLTDEQRSDVMKEFAPRAGMRIFDRGIRRRLFSMMGGDQARTRLAYSLQFTMPGTPVLRYGEEIGMGEDLKLPGRQAIRTPMQWDTGRNGGFSTASARDLVQPVPTRGRFGPKAINVRSQRRDSDSLLHWFEELIRTLRECPEIGVGSPSVINLPAPRSVLLHRFDAPEGSIVLLHNLSGQPVRVDLSSVDLGPDPSEVFADADYDPIEVAADKVELRGWGYRWVRVRRGR
jgi:maltose alpha-D-glucosyltransferase/alpha-amylase